jgi:hypothetical protein
MRWPVRKLWGDSARILRTKQSGGLVLPENYFSVCEKEARGGKSMRMNDLPGRDGKQSLRGKAHAWHPAMKENNRWKMRSAEP